MLWLDQTSLASALRSSVWVYPLVNSAHILGLSLLLGTISVLDLRLLGLWPSLPVSRIAPVLLSVSRVGFVIAAISGGLLFIARAADYLSNPFMLIKFMLLGLALLNVWLVHRSAGWPQAIEDRGIRTSVKVFAAASLLLWLSVMITGRLIGYR